MTPHTLLYAAPMPKYTNVFWAGFLVGNKIYIYLIKYRQINVGAKNELLNTTAPNRIVHGWDNDASSAPGQSGFSKAFRNQLPDDF